MWASKLILVQLFWQIEERHFNAVTWLIHWHYLDKLIFISFGSHILKIQSLKAWIELNLLQNEPFINSRRPSKFGANDLVTCQKITCWKNIYPKITKKQCTDAGLVAVSASGAQLYNGLKSFLKVYSYF